MPGRMFTLPVPRSTPAPPPEMANRLTHACGFVLSLVGAAVMLTTAAGTADAYRIVGCGVYVLSLVAVYAASTLSHSFDDPRTRDFYRLLDQVCIFLLVVGTYTPFGLVHLRHGAWWLLLAAMWLCAVLGIVVRMRRGSQAVAIPFYVLLGWMPVVGLWRILEVAPLSGLGLVLAGGLAYSGGTWFLANDHRRPYFHAVWHVCTIVGSACHYVFLLKYVAAA